MTRPPQIKINLKARAANAELRRAQTRAKLIEAGLDVLAAKGPGANIEHYAAAAGVARGTFYNYFPSTAELLDAIRRRFLRDVSVDLQPIMDGVGDPAARVALLSLHLIAYCARNPREARAVHHLDRLRPSRRPSDADPFADALRAGVASGRFRELDVEAARTLVSGSVRMAAVDAASGPGAVGAEAIVQLILGALGLDPREAETVASEAARRIIAASH